MKWVGRVIRIKVAIPLVVIGAALLFIAPRLVTKGVVESAASKVLGTPVSLEAFSISPLAGSVSFRELDVADPGEQGDSMAGAITGEGDLSWMGLLRKRAIIDRIDVEGPTLTLRRGEDGALNVEKIGNPPEEAKPPVVPEDVLKKTDWVKTFRDWVERLKTWREKLASEGKEEAPGVTLPPQAPDRLSPRYLELDDPRFLVRTMRLEGMTIAFDDAAKGEMPPITEVQGEIKNLSSSPWTAEEPITVDLAGNLGEKGRVHLNLIADLRLGKMDFDVKIGATDVDVRSLEPLLGDSLPVAWKEGTVSLDARAAMTGLAAIDIRPTIAFAGAAFDPKEPDGTIAGLPAARFCEELSRIGDFAIEDLRIDGTLDAPRFHWGDTVKQLVLEGGKKLVKEKAEEAAKGLLDKVGEKAGGGEAGKKIQEAGEGLLDKGLKIFGK
ncbi:MAG: DUF748 domain-containing protein [Planctomycetes bacterium]|nr:DUF748 domain-containing protein [Planctomycetota bacterium]